MRGRGPSREHGYYQRVILPLFDASGTPSPEHEAPPALSRRPLSPSERKVRVLQRVANSSPFMGDALTLLPELLTPGEVLLAEDIRARLESRGVEPPSPQGWGPLISRLIERQILRETGVWKPTRLSRGGSKRTPEYIVASVGDA